MATGINRLYEILAETTVQLRKGEVLEGTPELVNAVKNAGPDDKLENMPGGILEVFAMPHEKEADENLARVDVEFITIGVDRKKAAAVREELAALLTNDVLGPDLLRGGPSYITVGAEIGSQGAAFQLFAVGEVLGFWKIITPKELGFVGAEARNMAGMGLVMISGFSPEQQAAA